jgi:hypothetical protein
MKFVKDPREKTTAVTDIVLALVAIGGIVFLRDLLLNSGELWKISIWNPCQYYRSRNPGKQIR